MNLRILAPPLLRGPVVRPGVLGGPEVEVPQILGRPPTVALRFPTASLIEPRSFAIDKSGVPNLQDDSSVLAAPCEYRNPLSRDGAVAGAVTPVRDSVLLLSTPRVRRRESRPLVVLARNWRFSKCLRRQGMAARGAESGLFRNAVGSGPVVWRHWHHQSPAVHSRIRRGTTDVITCDRATAGRASVNIVGEGTADWSDVATARSVTAWHFRPGTRWDLP